MQECLLGSLPQHKQYETDVQSRRSVTKVDYLLFRYGEIKQIEKKEARLRKNTKASNLSAHLGQSFTHGCFDVHGADAIAGAMSHVSGLVGKNFDLFGPNK